MKINEFCNFILKHKVKHFVSNQVLTEKQLAVLREVTTDVLYLSYYDQDEMYNCTMSVLDEMVEAQFHGLPDFVCKLDYSKVFNLILSAFKADFVNPVFLDHDTVCNLIERIVSRVLDCQVIIVGDLMYMSF